MSLKQRSRQLAQKRFWEVHDPDGYTCPDCGRSIGEIYTDSFEVHHEDGDAFNNSLDNLVGLCSVCHNLREGKRPGAAAVKVFRKEMREKADGKRDTQTTITADGSGSKPPIRDPRTDSGQEGATFEQVGTVATRNQKGSIVIPIQQATDKSGNAGGDGLIFERSDEFVLTAEVVNEKPDGRKHELARAINEFGAGETKSVALPPAGLEHMGIDRTDAADGIDVELWVCTDPAIERPLVAVTPVIHQEMQFGVSGGNE